MRLKDISILTPQYTGKDIESEVSFVPMECLRYGKIEQRSIPFKEAKGKYTYFGEGDLLIAKVTPCFENGNVAIANKLANGIGFGSSEIFVLRINENATAEYMFYLSQTSDFKDQACSTMCGVGGLKRISPLFMRTYEWNLPNLRNQKKIVLYLKEKTEFIDNTISILTKKRNYYTRLKSSIINNVVTRGLDEKVEFKDSGIDWIGMIPAHWNCIRTKDIIQMIKGKTPTDFTFEEIGSPYLNMDYLRDREDKPILYPTNSEGLVEIEGNEILVLWDGANAGEFIFSKKGYLGSTMAMLKIDERVYNKRYFYALLKNIESTSKYFANGTTIPHFDSNVLLGYSYPVPPLEEQLEIANYLDEKCVKIDAAIANIDKQIDAMKRLKRALINEVVTGKREA
ncbi:MAG: restriction endonuclease subunit S [Bacteroidales bacterium]|nr:restriction endonuclease subunit S [Candidatus Liminaster caballi]